MAQTISSNATIENLSSLDIKEVLNPENLDKILGPFRNDILIDQEKEEKFRVNGETVTVVYSGEAYRVMTDLIEKYQRELVDPVDTITVLKESLAELAARSAEMKIISGKCLTALKVYEIEDLVDY